MISIILGLIMSIFHFLSEEFSVRTKSFYIYVLSFSAGISVTYLFLDLMPNFSKGAAEISDFLFMTIVLGFLFFHLVEKYIYKHYPEDKLLKELAIEDSIISFIYHFVVGMLIVNFMNQSIAQGLLFFIPVLFYTTVSTLPVDSTQKRSIRIIVASSTLLGILFTKFVYTNMAPIVFYSLLGLVIGSLTFTVMRHSIPKGSKGKPLYFVLGVLVYSLIIYLI